MIYIQLKIMFIMGQKKNDITPGGGVRKFFNILQNIYIHLKKYCLHIIQNTFFS